MKLREPDAHEYYCLCEFNGKGMMKAGIWLVLWCHIEGACLAEDETAYVGLTLGLDGVE